MKLWILDLIALMFIFIALLSKQSIEGIYGFTWFVLAVNAVYLCEIDNRSRWKRGRN